MAIIKKSGAPPASIGGGGSAFVLPSEKKKPSFHLEDFSVLLYGQKKIGKTSLASQFDKALLLEFEAGAKALEAFQVDIPNWSTALKVQKAMIQEKSFRNAVIDTGKICYDQALEYVCNRDGMTHPSDGAYGKGWNAVSVEFQKFHSQFATNSIGLLILAHEKTTEKELPSGLKQISIEPDLSGSSLNYYHGMVDIVAYYQYIGSDRFITIRGCEGLVAGSRCSANFKTPKGEPLWHIPAGQSAEEAYENFVTAFQNKQTDTFEDLTSKAKTTSTKNFKKELKK